MDDPALAWTVDRGDVVADLVEPGTLRAAGSNIVSVAGQRPRVGDHPSGSGGVARAVRAILIARLETRDLQADLQQAVDSVHDVEFARQVADLELLEATAGYDSDDRRRRRADPGGEPDESGV